MSKTAQSPQTEETPAESTQAETEEVGAANPPAPVDPPDALPSLLEIALSSQRQRIEGIVVGNAFWNGGDVRVTFPGCPSPDGMPTLAMVPLHSSDDGAEVGLMFEQGDPSRPCILGKMASKMAARPPAVETSVTPTNGVEVVRDGERLLLRAEQEIVLACGKASITLTRAGKVIVRGAYVLSASTGVHRILGATVEIN